MGKQEMHFKTDAETVVNLARSMVIEKNWRRALPALTQTTIPPMSLEDAIRVLKGEKTLVATGGKREVTAGDKLELADQDPSCPRLKRMLAIARWQHAGMYESPDGEFYQPYAIIEGFGWQDRRPVLKRLKDQEDWCTTNTYRTERARHYMDDARNDVVFFLPGPKVVLMQRVQGPPFWMPFFTDPAEAFADFCSVRAPEVRGESAGQATTEQPDTLEFYEGALEENVLYGTDDYLNAADCQLLEETAAMLADAKSDWDENIAWSHYWKTKVDRQAEKQGGFINIRANEAGEVVTYRVARYPFLRWARQHHFQPGELPVWTRVCHDGLKMRGDNPIHTDWWVSSGLPLRTAYDHQHPLNKAAWSYAYRLAGTANSQFMKLAGKGKVTGPVVFPKENEGVPAGSIAVVSHAGPAFELALLSACKDDTGAVIAEVGGKLAHLAIVSRELGARLAVREGALSLFKEGDIVTLDFDTGELKRHGYDQETNERYPERLPAGTDGDNT